jgi:hypothetical protein
MPGLADERVERERRRRDQQATHERHAHADAVAERAAGERRGERADCPGGCTPPARILTTDEA